MKNLNLNVDDGFKTFSINNDPSRTIRVNLSDFDLMRRLSESEKRIEQYIGDFDYERDMKEAHSMSDPEVYVYFKLDELVRKEINYIFNADICDTVFGSTNVCSLSGGRPIYQNFLFAIIPEIKKCLNKERQLQINKKKKYTAAQKYKKNKGAKKK